MNVSPLLEARYFSLLVYKCFRPALRACRGGLFFLVIKTCFARHCGTMAWVIIFIFLEEFFRSR